MGNYENWNSQCKMYSESLEIFKGMHLKSQTLLKNLNNYFYQIYQEIDELNEKIINPDYEKSFRKRTPSMQKAIGKIGKSNSTNNQNLGTDATSPYASFITAQLSALKASQKSLNNFIDNNQKLFQEHHAKMKEVYTKAIDAIKSVEDSRKFYEKAYKEYSDAGEQLKKAYDSNSSKLDEKKENFIEKQSKAVESHTHLNEVTAQTALFLESAMTQFEDQEQNKYETFNQIIKGFGFWLEELAKNFDESSLEYDDLITGIPTVEEIGALLDASLVSNPKSEIIYQLIKVNPDLSIHLKPKHFFAEEQTPGRTVYRVIEDYTGEKGFISVKKGHLVLALEQHPPNVYVKDINECEGLLPLNILEIPS